MVAKYEAAHFGFCPRVYCNQTKVLPGGRSDLPGVDGVKLFCPNCLDTYTPPSSRFNGVDGAFFGTSFPHLLFQQHPELVPILNNPTSSVPRSVSASPGPSRSGSALSPDLATTAAMQAEEFAAAAAAAAAPAASIATGDGISADHENEKSTFWTSPTTSTAKIYIPRIYGFKVSERARSGPRMQWLRLRCA